MTLAKKMKPLLALVALLALAACDFGTLDEINFRGAPLHKGADPFAEAVKFATAWTEESDLEIVYRTHSVGSPSQDSTAHVNLRPKGSPEFLTTVIVYAPDGLLFASVAPASKTPRSEELAAVAVRAYSKLYGKSEFVRFQRRRGLLGP